MSQTANEKLLTGAIRHQINLHSYSNQVVTDILSLLNAADKELTAKLSVRLEAGKETWSSRRLQALIREISQINAENYGAAAKLLKTEMVELAGVEAGVAAGSLAKTLPQYTTKVQEFKNSITLKITPEGSDYSRGSLLLWPQTDGKNKWLSIAQSDLNERWQGQGYGTAMYEEGLRWAKEHGYQGLLSAPGEHNENSDRLWKSPDSTVVIDGMEYDSKSSTFLSTGLPKDATPTEIIFSITQPTAEQLAAIVTTEAITLGPDGAELLDDIFKTLATGKEARIRQAIRMGMAEGESITSMVQRLIGTRAARFTDGILEKDRRAAEAIVRTAVNHISNKAADLTYRQNADLISGVQWVLTLDTRTCPVCVRNAQGGKPYKMDEGPRPPVHVNDRCFMVPVLRSWKELGIDTEEFDAGSRASMDGIQAGDMQYGDWLRKYPNHAVEALGPTRAKMFLRGEIKVENFVNNKGKMLTLSELQAK